MTQTLSIAVWIALRPRLNLILPPDEPVQRARMN